MDQVHNAITLRHGQMTGKAKNSLAEGKQRGKRKGS
jgi:hypothetical protein